MTAAHTPGVIKCASFPMIEGRGFSVNICRMTEGGFSPPEAEQRANATRLAAVWNALHGLTLEQVEVLGAFLGACNVDEIAEHIDSIRP